MIIKQLTIINKLGLHARASMKLVNMAGRFVSTILIRVGEQEVNAKSVMGLMVLAASQGTAIEVIVSGSDEQFAAQAIAELIQSRFDEAE